jgi:hypothetical protein
VPNTTSAVAESKSNRVAGSSVDRNGHRFFLNPHEDMAFTKCPKCEAKTRVRKFPLVIHIEPDQMFILNKQCRYCVGCDLIIARRSEIESLMAAAFESRDPAIIGNEYLVVGTLPREVWRARVAGGQEARESGGFEG